MKTGVTCNEKSVHWENPALALYWPCTGVQCGLGHYLILFGCTNKNLIKPETLHETDLKLSALNKIERHRNRSKND